MPSRPWLPGDRPTSNPHGTRSAVVARRGLMATSQPLASAAGLEMLIEGGNAVDAAVTAAAVLSVIEPTMTGVGGDLFAIVVDGRTKKPHGLNASGRSPSAASLDMLRRLGHHTIPDRGILSVTVPGAVSGWVALLERHGTIGLERALAPAIRYAAEGFPLPEIVAGEWEAAAPLLAADRGAAETFLPGGRAPRPGEIFRNPRLARTLEQIASDGAAAFYGGPIGAAIIDDSKQRGGLLERDDLTRHRSDWVEPLRTAFRDCEVLELPPNTQGVTALQILNVLENDDLAALGHNTPEYLHLLSEAIRLSFADRDRVIADPAAVPPPVLERLLSKEYARDVRSQIRGSGTPVVPVPLAGRSNVDGPGGRVRPGYPTPRSDGDTVCLAAADANGMAVSLIQSLFGVFGAGIVAGTTGIVLQSRGSLFSSDAEHPNHLAPQKRPFHTLIPALVLKTGRPWLAFGVMGGDMQPQGHVQVLLNLIEFGMNVQEAGEAARMRWTPDGLALESAIDTDVRDALVRRGHSIVENSVGFAFGGFQGVLIDPETGVLMGGSDPRKDGLAIGY